MLMLLGAPSISCKSQVESYITAAKKIFNESDCIYHVILIYYNAQYAITMCDWNYEEMKEKETVSAKAKAKDINTFEKKEERPLTAIS